MPGFIFKIFRSKRKYTMMGESSNPATGLRDPLPILTASELNKSLPKDIFNILETKRFQSTMNILNDLQKIKKNKKSRYPSLKKNPHLKKIIISVFEKTKGLLKINRPDIENIIGKNKGHENQILAIRNKIDKIIKEEISKMVKKNIDSVSIQQMFGKIISIIYKKYQYDASALCGEATYLFYNELCNKGINKELIRVIHFQNNGNAKNHGLILFSSNKKIFTEIEERCGFGFKNIKENSFKHFIDLLNKIKNDNKNNQLIIIDPWSKDNKVIDLMYRDDHIYQLITKNEQMSDEKTIEERYLCVIISHILRESDTAEKGLTWPDVSVSVHQPFLIHPPRNNQPDTQGLTQSMSALIQNQEDNISDTSSNISDINQVAQQKNMTPLFKDAFTSH